MPVVARMVAVAVGATLIIGGASVFVAVRPLTGQATLLGIVTGGLGVDLLAGGIRGTWPVSALLWLVPH